RAESLIVEKPLVEGQPAGNWRDAFTQKVESHRRAASERISLQRQRLRELDAQLAAKFDEAAAQLRDAQQQASSDSAKVHANDGALQERQDRLEARERRFDERQVELEREHDKLKASLQAQIELNRSQSEASRELVVQHSA